MNDSNTALRYPTRVGAAADLMFVVKPRAFLADSLLLYDEVVIPASYFVLMALYADFRPEELQPLLDAGRIKFAPPGSETQWARNPAPFTLDRFLARVPEFLEPGGFETVAKQAVIQVEHNLLENPGADYRCWLQVYDRAQHAFDAAAARPEYSWLYPTDSLSGNPSLDRVAGLRAGIARINDLLAVGVTDLDLDLEIATLLDICYPSQNLRDVLRSDVATVSVPHLASTLHRIENLPPLSRLSAIEGWPNDKLIRVLLSDEAHLLRQWLRANISPGVDVRDAFLGATKSLPSRSAWTGWVRFGAVSAVTTLIGALLTGQPVVATAVGLAVSAADQRYGVKLTERIADPYHPTRWLSFVKAGGVR